MNPPLSEWQSFYVIVGSSGAALIGIQFVVMTLIANMRDRPTAESLSAFGTPTVMHLAGALLGFRRSDLATPVTREFCGKAGLAPRGRIHAIPCYTAQHAVLNSLAFSGCEKGFKSPPSHASAVGSNGDPR
jgi:hypothetical protein